MATSDTQTDTVQALRDGLATVGSDKDRLALLIRLSDELWKGSFADARPCLQEAMELARATGSHENMAHCAKQLAEAARIEGDLESSLRHAERVLEAAKASGSKRIEGSYHYLVGLVNQARCDYVPARECYERSRALWREAGYLEGVQAVLNQLGSLLGIQGQPADALSYYQECLAIDDELGDDRHRAMHNYNAGFALQQLGRWEDAVESYYRALALSDQSPQPGLRGYVFNALGEIYLTRDKPTKAVEMFRSVIDARSGPGEVPESVREALCNLGLAHYRQGDFASAEHAYTEVRQQAERAGDLRQLSVVLRRSAELALAQSQTDRARELAAQAHAVAHEHGLRSEEGEALRVEGLVLAALGDSEHARDCFEDALAMLQELEDSYELSLVRYHYGRFLIAEGERENARAHLKAAARVFRKLSVVREAEEVNRLLFRQELRADRDMALLSGVSGLATMGLEPSAFLEQTLDLLCEALKFECAAVLATGRPVLIRGRPSLDAAREHAASPELRATRTALSWPVAFGGKLLGHVYLERSIPLEPKHNHLVLETLANLLATPIQRLTEIPIHIVEEREDLAGLRYLGVVGENPLMVKVLAMVSRVAATSAPVLIRGESGTGKELVARALHESGPRVSHRFVAINCAALPENLLEAEFFGVEKGAATGVAARKGRFETADNGTVFLDEIGDMSPALQAKLLRVLQEKCFERVGGREMITVDVRVVAATNQNLSDLMLRGLFRKDLYYRLNTVELELPPLRERKEDIAELVRHFIARSNHEFGRSVADAGPEVMARFRAHPWPGNIRELQHAVERAVLLTRGSVLQVADLPPEFQVTPESAAPTTGLRAAKRDAQAKAGAEVERTRVQECLDQTCWNVSEAAKLAGYSRAQFYRLITKHGIARPRE